jgi:serine/threonine protein kinase
VVTITDTTATHAHTPHEAPIGVVSNHAPVASSEAVPVPIQPSVPLETYEALKAETAALQARLHKFERYFKLQQQHVKKDSRGLGKGAYGEVVSGTYFDRPVAIKKLDLRRLHGRDAFLKELVAQTSTHCRNVVEVYGGYENEAKQKGYIVMELMHQTLHQGIHDATPTQPLNIRFRWLMDVANGLRSLHARAIIHSDLKPTNVLLSSKDAATAIAKLSDFGSIKTRAMDESLKETHINILGTYAYMDPVLFREGAGVTLSSDVFSFAILAWEVLTAQEPFSEYNTRVDAFRDARRAEAGGAEAVVRPPIDAVRHTLKGEVPSPRVINDICELIETCWHREPVERVTAEKLVLTLDGIYARLPAT